MAGFTQKLRSKLVLRIAALATVGIAVSGCTYDVGLGYASDGYGYGGGSGYYDCDPYSPFDNYYDCDNGYGYSNIGYGGGWYDNLWYPGYGFFLFDNYGQRYNMRNSHRRYWGERRHRWYRENRGRHDGGARRGRRNSNDDGIDAIGQPEHNGGRARDGERGGRNRGDGGRARNDQLRGEDGNGASAVPIPNTEIVNGRGGGEGYANRRRRTDFGQGNSDWRGNGESTAAPMPRADRPGGRGNGLRQPPPVSSSNGQSESPRPEIESPGDNPRLAPPVPGRNELDRVPD